MIFFTSKLNSLTCKLSKAPCNTDNIAYALLAVLCGAWAWAGPHDLRLASDLFMEMCEKLNVVKGRKTSFPVLTCCAVAQSVFAFLYRTDLSLCVETQNDIERIPLKVLITRKNQIAFPW